MDLHGKNFIGGQLSAGGVTTFNATNPATGESLDPPFHLATEDDVNAALAHADQAFPVYRRIPTEQRAAFLDRIAEEILALGDVLIKRAQAETALPEARLLGERGRTIGQLKMFAELIREGSWVEATIDHALPDRKPLPRVDLRRMLIPLGPVVIFGASNFPLAFSVAGGDTASALAAGNPVIVKAHPGHPGTSELTARAIQTAAEATKMPPGVFSMLHADVPTGVKLVQHPLAKAVGFTGSLQGGRALFNIAAARPEPIPVYAEMGSINPVFVLPGAMAKNGPALAEGLMQSVTMGTGQFCTNPGLVIGVQNSGLETFVQKAGELAGKFSGTMLTHGICERFHDNLAKVRELPGVTMQGTAPVKATSQAQAAAAVLSTDAPTFLRHHELQEEIFGPVTLIVGCKSAEELETIARNMAGQLTATIHGTEQDLADHRNLIAILEQKVGRLLFNGFPTGVEVCPSMQHGGPYPATTDSRSTSVGTGAIKRFARPICYQNFPDATLPEELRDANPRKIWRLVDNQMSR